MRGPQLALRSPSGPPLSSPLSPRPSLTAPLSLPLSHCPSLPCSSPHPLVLAPRPIPLSPPLSSRLPRQVFEDELEAASTERRLAHTELLRAFDGDAAGGDEELEVLSMHSPRDKGEEVADWKTVVQTVGSRPPDTGPGWSMPRRAALPPARTSPPSLLDASPTAPADAEPAGGDGSSDVSCSSAMSNQLGTHVSAIKNLYK